jgi:dipeptidyl aminopeptidase/acylaminoacyl peptidase
MTIAAYGSWKSPITSDLVTAGSLRLDSIVLDGDDTYWLESRAEEQGRSVIMQCNQQRQITQVTPANLNVRNRVHEYGGAAYLVHDGHIYFCHDADQCIYRQVAGQPLQLASPATQLPKQTKARRYADLMMDERRQRLICVYEDHRSPDMEPINAIVSISLSDPENLQVLFSGSDFYANPCLSPDGTTLSWLSWNHPQMPWDGNALMIATVQADGSLSSPQLIAGSTNESIFQPQWSPEGILHFISDRTGWGNLYCWDRNQVKALFAANAEFGLPQWVFGQSTYGFAGMGDRFPGGITVPINNRQVVCTYTQGGIWHLAILDTATGEITEIDQPYTEISQLQVTATKAVFLGASPTQSAEIVELDLQQLTCTVLQTPPPVAVDPRYFSHPQVLAFPTTDQQIAYAFYYPPTNPDYQAPTTEKPPVLVKSHGGPTGSTSSQLNLRVQYWTSRGFGYLDVNYRGSTGYGRAYMRQLDGQWGILDVQDCIDGAQYLVQKGWADADRLAISGGSAGGYTTLCALTFHDVFKAGASHYGVSDLTALAKDTHKFESRYLDRLVAPYPQGAEIYQERSPINFPEKLHCPTIFFQGLEDAVVPPNQATLMVDALKARGVAVAYVPFAGEQHGFRQAPNIKRALEGEFYFYSQVFGFAIAELIEPLHIDNFP